MAETGVGYKLDSGTLAAVRGAGIGGETQEHLGKAAGAEALQGVAKGVEERIVEKQEDTSAREDAWDTGFDEMGDRGSWASGELFDQFQLMEESYKDEYLEAVRTGDTKAQKRMLKDQGSRSNGLQEWKGTMETAKKINDSSTGWSDSLGQDDKDVLKALTKLDGETAKVRFGEQGEMVFDITLPDGRVVTKTRRQVDEMVAGGVYPAELELSLIKTNRAQVENGLDGGMFDLEGTASELALSITDDQLPALMNQKWKFGGGGSFREHIKTHPTLWAEAFKGFEYATTVKAEDGSGLVSPTDPNSPGGAEITDEEAKQFTDGDMDRIIDALEEDPKQAKGYVADWLARTQQQNFQKGQDEKAARDEAEREKNKSETQYKDTRTSDMKNYDAAQARIKKITKEAKKDIVIDGANFGNVRQFKLINDVWHVMPEQTPLNDVLKRWSWTGDDGVFHDMTQLENELINKIEYLKLPNENRGTVGVTAPGAYD